MTEESAATSGCHSEVTAPDLLKQDLNGSRKRRRKIRPGFLHEIRYPQVRYCPHFGLIKSCLPQYVLAGKSSITRILVENVVSSALYVPSRRYVPSVPGPHLRATRIDKVPRCLMHALYGRHGSSWCLH